MIEAWNFDPRKTFGTLASDFAQVKHA